MNYYIKLNNKKRRENNMNRNLLDSRDLEEQLKDLKQMTKQRNQSKS